MTIPPGENGDGACDANSTAALLRKTGGKCSNSIEPWLASMAGGGGGWGLGGGEKVPTVHKKKKKKEEE